VRLIETAPGLRFEVATAGAPEAPLVLLLHGFAVSYHLWDAVLPALGAAGYCAAAPSQRGYCASARPDPADLAQYDIERLIGDALAIAEALSPGRRYHLVGHDWGGSLAWDIAYHHAARIASLTMVSRPHPLAFNRALAEDPEQPRRSGHHKWFLAPDAVPKLLAEECRWLRERHAAQGIPPAQSAKHLAVLGNAGAMTAALAWYRARGVVHRPIGPVTVPTLYLWGNNDDTVGRMAAEGTAAHIAAPYRFVELDGGGHYPPDQMPERVAAELLAHLAAHPA
jgi:pimeloyl-ACP methyl ester carboxylesterase